MAEDRGLKTLKRAKEILSQHGMTITKQSTGEYRVAFIGNLRDVEPSAYYSDDLDDALATGLAMALQRLSLLEAHLNKTLH